MNSSTQIFKTSLDNFAKIITSIISLTALIGIADLFFPNLPLSGMAPFSGLGILTAFCYAYSVTHYTLTENNLILNRPFPALNKELLIPDIKIARAGSNEDFKGGLRTAANGGLFGYFGLFYSPSLKTFRMYARNRKNPVILYMKNGTIIVLSSDDPAFTDKINDRILGQSWVNP